MPETFNVKTTVFEGPLELLLNLIESRKLLINEISLAEVTDAYIAHVRQLQEDHTTATAQFVLVAATLLLIKSKSLLPVLELTEEESQNVSSLEDRLRLYQIYRNASRHIGGQLDASPLFEKIYIPDETPLFSTDSYTQIPTLLQALKDVIVRFPKKVFTPKVSVKKVMSLEEMIQSVEDRITRQFKLSFSDLTHAQERPHIIISFLAVLELVKQGTIMVRQETHLDDIAIERGEVGTPRYR
jgi:segregation and condensation protein A